MLACPAIVFGSPRAVYPTKGGASTIAVLPTNVGSIERSPSRRLPSCGREDLDTGMKQSLEPVVAVIDDDPSLRRSLTNLLGSVGLAAQSYASAELFLANGCTDLVACVLLDLRLPGMSGLELARELRAHHPDLPVVILSAQGDAATRRRCLEAGVFAFLTKPFVAKELVQTLRDALVKS